MVDFIILMSRDHRGRPRVECCAEDCPAEVVDGMVVCVCPNHGTEFEAPGDRDENGDLRKNLSYNTPRKLRPFRRLMTLFRSGRVSPPVPSVECGAEDCSAKVVDGKIVCPCIANGTKFEATD